jgi:hypothetical protein
MACDERIPRPERWSSIAAGGVVRMVDEEEMVVQQ